MRIIFLATHEGHWSAASWELDGLQPYHGRTPSCWFESNTSPSLCDSAIFSVTLHSTPVTKQLKVQKIILLKKAVVDWCRCLKSPSEAGSLCVSTKVYHSGGSTDLRPLISSLRSQTHNDPHLSGNVQLVSDTTTECEFR